MVPISLRSRTKMRLKPIMRMLSSPLLRMSGSSPRERGEPDQTGALTRRGVPN